RPSDAIALAVRFGCPIFVSTEVLERAGVIPEKDEEEQVPEKLDEDRLAVFRGLVNSLNLPDLPDEPGGKVSGPSQSRAPNSRRSCGSGWWGPPCWGPSASWRGSGPSPRRPSRPWPAVATSRTASPP